VASAGHSQQQDFDGFLARINNPGAPLTSAQKESLFREFLVWQNSHHSP